MKKIIIISGLLLTAGVLFAKDKATNLIAEYESVFKLLKIKLGGISNVDLSNSQLTANVVLHITNPTAIHLGVDTNNYVTLKKLLFFTESGKHIGDAYPDISKFSLPAQSTIPIPAIPVVVPIKLSVAVELAMNSSNLQVQAEIEVLNQTYTI